MKKYLLVMIAAISLVACSESNEEKAEKLIKKEMNKVLVNIETYEPIETVMDTAFAPVITAENFNIIAKLPAQIDLYTSLQDEVNSAERSMNLFKSIDKTQYNQYKEQYDRASAQLQDLESNMTAINERIANQAKQEKVFNGFIACHSYRYVTKGGEKTIGQLLFLFDKDLSEVEATIDLEDEKIKAMFELFNITNFPTN